MAKFRKPLRFALALLPIAIAAGICTGFYLLDSYSEEILAEIEKALGSVRLLIPISTAQTVSYALICGFFGYILAEKAGLWRDIRLEKKPLMTTLILSVIGGVLFSLDHWVFGSIIDGIQEANAARLTVCGLLSSVLYGGIIEEVMLRLFFMSLIAVVYHKLFDRKTPGALPGVRICVAANMTAALVFAALHLPATIAIFGTLTPLIIFRCFLLNGGFGLVFGRLYRKYGIAYAMISHALFHIVSCAMIWIFSAPL